MRSVKFYVALTVLSTALVVSAVFYSVSKLEVRKIPSGFILRRETLEKSQPLWSKNTVGKKVNQVRVTTETRFSDGSVDTKIELYF